MIRRLPAAVVSLVPLEPGAVANGGRMEGRRGDVILGAGEPPAGHHRSVTVAEAAT